ncbi:transposase [Neisseria meningitidis]|nr:transposase [Neisseria meningitidis]
MGIGGGNVQFLDIAFPIGTGMLFVTEFVEAVFLDPTGIFVLTRCGLAVDLSFFIDFYSLTLCAAGGLNNGGVNNGSGCFLYF